MDKHHILPDGDKTKCFDNKKLKAKTEKYLLKPVCIELAPWALNIMLPTYTAECRHMQHAAHN